MDRAEIYLRLLAEREIRDRTSLDRLRQAATTLADAGALDEATITPILDGAEMGRVVRTGNPQFRRPMPRLRPRPAPDNGEWRVVPVAQPITARTGVIMVSAVLRTGQGVFLAAVGGGGEHISLADLVALSAADDQGNLYGFSRDCPAALELSPTPPPDITWLTIKDDDAVRRRVDLTITAIPPATEPAAGSPAERLLVRRAEATLAAAAARNTGFVKAARLGDLAEVLREAGLLAADSQVPARLAALCQHLGLPRGDLPTPTELPERWHDVLTRISRRQRPVAAEVEPITPLAIPLPDLDGLRVLLTGFGGSRLHLIAQDRPTTGMTPLSIWARDTDGHHHVAGTGDLHIRGNGLTSAQVTMYPPLPAEKTPVTLTITARDTTATVTIP